jgi:hypothetical protein
LESVLATAFPPSSPPVLHAGLIVGNETKDDAAVFDTGGEDLLVATTDFFTPVVDDAYTFGRIAAANALSDVYGPSSRSRSSAGPSTSSTLRWRVRSSKAGATCAARQASHSPVGSASMRRSRSSGLPSTVW